MQREAHLVNSLQRHRDKRIRDWLLAYADMVGRSIVMVDDGGLRGSEVWIMYDERTESPCVQPY